jgi:hypothetical protein
MITFLASGLWHGASWNYVLWGAYHGVLLIVARTVPSLPRRLKPLQVAGMFALTCAGWLIFRETELPQLIADFQLSPADSTPLGRSTGLYLFLLTGIYSLPLWLHDLWAEMGAPNFAAATERFEAEVHWPKVAMQAALCGVMMAAVLTLRSTASLNFIYFAF